MAAAAWVAEHFTPYGTYVELQKSFEAYEQGDYAASEYHDTMAALGLVPGGIAAAKAGKSIFNGLRSLFKGSMDEVATAGKAAKLQSHHVAPKHLAELFGRLGYDVHAKSNLMQAFQKGHARGHRIFDEEIEARAGRILERWQSGEITTAQKDKLVNDLVKEFADSVRKDPHRLSRTKKELEQMSKQNAGGTTGSISEKPASSCRGGGCYD